MIVLASASPRRRALLEQIGCTFCVETSEAEELTEGEPSKLVLYNAREKARAVVKRRKARGVEELPVVAADTLVALDGKVYGKPRDAAEAKAMLRALAGKEHSVITGLVLIDRGRIYEETSETRVCFSPMTETEIEDYVATGEPLDKAGSYAVQGRAALYIERIEGSYSNVVGLPLHVLRTMTNAAEVSMT